MSDSFIASPDGKTQFRIGERVGTQCDYPYAERVISGYEDGSWSPDASLDDTAWFVFEDGWRARPFVLIKLPKSSTREDTLRRHLWHNIGRALNGRPPARITSADLLDIARKLGLKRIIDSSSFKKLAEMQNATNDRNDM